MLCYSLNCKKIQKVKTREFQSQIKENQCFYQNVQCVEVKTQDFSKNKKLIDYY